MKSILSSFSKKVLFSVSSALLAFGVLTPSSYAATFVDTELYLSVDVSGSVDSNEFNLQKQGYVNAFLNQDVQNIIEASQNGLAVAFGYWSGSTQQQTAVDFTLLKTAADAVDFANLIDATTRPFGGSTGLGQAIDFASNALLTNDFDGSRLVIDVSGDGFNNVGIAPSTARDAAAANGIIINGLPIGNSNLLTYFEDNVQVGDNSFSILATDFASVDAAVQQKLFREIAVTTPSTDVPEPGILLGLIGVGASAFVGSQRKGRESAA